MMNVKHILTLLLLPLAVLFASCSSCYGGRFASEMVGRPISEAVRLLGKPTKISEVDGGQRYDWSVDQSYIGEKFVEDYRDAWDPFLIHGHKERDYVTRFSKLSFTVSAGRITDYSTSYVGAGMCNYFVPYDYLKRYVEEADKAADKR